jgi:hypothetical protein
MAINLTPEEIAYLKELETGDQTMTGLRDRSGLTRIVQAGYVTEHSRNVGSTVYSITDAGRQALAKAKDSNSGQ